MKIDAMATAVDWLDAYRAGDIESILNLFADNAGVECRCGTIKINNGRHALQAYCSNDRKSPSC
jgi:ketosteroid isomerase-like protein